MEMNEDLVNEELVIDSKLIEIKNRTELILDYNHYKNKVQSIRITQLRIEVYSFVNALRSDLEKLPIIPYTFQQLTDLSNTLNIKFKQVTFSNIPKSFLEARNNSWHLIKDTINSSLTLLSERLFEIENNLIVKREDNVLNSYQIALLIIYLRNAKIISDKLDDKIVVNYFEKLTGYSKYKLRNLITGTNKNEKNLITDIERNYDELISTLSKIIKNIETDKKDAILKKSKERVIK